MITLLLIQKIASLFLIMAVGFAIVRFKLVKPEDSKVLSVLAVYAISPCAIISAFQVEITPDVVNGFLLAVVAAIVLMGGQILFVTILAKPLHLTPIESASSIYSNCGNLILPLVGFCLGDEWTIYSLAYMSVLTILIWTHGKAVIQERREFNLMRILLDINLISTVVGLVLFALGIKIPAPFSIFLDDMGQWIGPVNMLVTGMLVGGMTAHQVLANKRVWLVTFIRLVLIPLICCLVLKYCGAASLVANGQNILMITLLAAITPSASNVVQQAQVYGKDAPYASAINVITTLMCIITIPIWVTVYFM